MEKDVKWKGYFDDDERYADIINGIGCKGEQIIKGTDLCEMNPQGKRKVRDLLRKSAFGMNFAIIGIENQELIDYSMPLRNMSYDIGEYEKQAGKIRREVRKSNKKVSGDEYLYGFRKEDRLHPVITFILYTGVKEWDGPETLREMLDLTDMPRSMTELIPDYKMNLVEIRKFTDTSVFKTDVRQVFDFIRCSEDKDALKELVERDDYYKNMKEDAFDVVAHYTNATELIEAKKQYNGKEGKINMCTAIKEMIEEGKTEGKEAGLRALVDSLSLLLPDFDAVYQAVIRNEDYKSVTKEQAMKYYINI